MKNKSKNVLVFSPHPDDHIVCAGTLLKLKKKGYKIYEILFTNGETGGQTGKKNVTQEDTKKKRKKEFKKASKILGTEKVFKLDLKTNGVKYSQGLFFDLIKLIREVRPCLAMIPHSEDYHRDHREVADIASDAIKRAGNSFVLHLGEAYRVPVTFHYRGLEPLDEPDLFVDTSDEFEDVMKIVRVYATQMTERMKQYLFALPSLMGYYMKTKYAENYEVPKKLPIYPDGVLKDLE